MAHPPLPDWLDADRADFMQAGVSISLGARDAALRPSVAKGIGCRVLADGEVRVFVDATQSRALLDDVRANGLIAVAFSEIVRHRTLQIKASDACVRPLDADDLHAVERYEQQFGAQIVRVGHAETMARDYLRTAPEDRAALVFHPHEAFEQTPGPQAGQRLEAGR